MLLIGKGEERERDRGIRESGRAREEDRAVQERLPHSKSQRGDCVRNLRGGAAVSRSQVMQQPCFFFLSVLGLVPTQMAMNNKKYSCSILGWTTADSE